MGKKTLSHREELNCWFYIIPGMVIMLVLVLVPVVYSFYMSFFNIKSLGAKWVFSGFHNYLQVFRTRGWLAAFCRTIAYGSWGIVTGMSLTLLLSFIVAKHKMLNALRYVFYLPCVVSAITIGRLWNFMFTPDEFGLVNAFLLKINIISQPINFLGNDRNLVGVILITSLYGAGGGMGLVLFTTAINNISASVRESAILEGASDWDIAIKIEIPEIVPLIKANVILSVVGAFKSFEGLYALVPNASATETIGVLLYKESLYSSYGYGLASAMGVVLTVIVMTIMTVYIYFPSKKEEE